MADKTINFIEAQLEAHIQKHRPPVDMRDKLDFGYHYDGRNIELFTLRPNYHSPETIMKLPYAKMSYIKSRKTWKLYWMRASGKWESYEPHPTASHLQELLDVVEEDAYGCFHG